MLPANLTCFIKLRLRANATVSRYSISIGVLLGFSRRATSVSYGTERANRDICDVHRCHRRLDLLATP